MPKILVNGDMNISGVARALAVELKAVPSPKANPSPWDVREGQFNSWFSELLNESSEFHQFKPDIMLTVLSPRLLTEFPNLEEAMDGWLEQVKAKAGNAKVFCTSLAADPTVAQPLVENLRAQELASRINGKLLALQREKTWFHVVDFQAFVTANGMKQIYDNRFESVGRMFLSPPGAQLFAKYLKRSVVAAFHTPKKVLVLDLDNTLWGGILGEDGPEGIKCGGEGVGYAFRRFQNALLKMKENGVLLAICSKNNEADALDVLKNHPDFHLRPEHFVAHRINWQPKPENLASIAEELNLGLDSFVFFDDSEFEIEGVRQALPMVDVIHAPTDPSDYVRVLSEYTGFDVYRVTEEDRARSKQYLDEAKRQTIKRSSGNIEEFYNSLSMEATITKATEKTLPRVLQLIHKTNQFNLTTLRLDESEVRKMLNDPSYALYTLRLQDRLGESGLTGLVILQNKKEHWEILNLMLSCRIIGRTVEFALMRFIADRAQSAGAKELVARFIKSERNQVAQNYLPSAGFSQVGSTDQWKLALSDAGTKIPKHHVKVIAE